MSVQADHIRDRRRAAAAPGAAHDRLIRLLNQVLPASVGMILAVMLVSPLFPKSEVSFLLDRNKVAITRERLKVADATYRGADNLGRPFQVTAGSAVQHSARVPVVLMQNLNARIQMKDGPAQVVARTGSYDIREDRMLVDGPIQYTAADGYRMQTQGVTIDLRNRHAAGSGGVSGTGPAGTFSADRLSADLAERTVALDGHARLHMIPGKMRNSQ